jgi:hypothetical protein
MFDFRWEFTLGGPRGQVTSHTSDLKDLKDLKGPQV